jgi:hypothetical protein
VQIEAYKAASHGWFFWNWKDGNGPDWNFQEAFKEGCFSGPAPALPSWNGIGEDPLEDKLNPVSLVDGQVCFGDSIFLRGHHGCCMDAEKCSVQARWTDTGGWQRFTLHPPLGASQDCRQILHGDVVRLCSHTDRFLYVTEDGQLSAGKRFATVDPNGLSEFIACTSDKQPLRHRKVIFLQSRVTSCMIDTGEDDDDVRVRWNKCGEWQRWVIEKDMGSPQFMDLTEPSAELLPVTRTHKPQKRTNSHKNALENTLDEAVVITLAKGKKRRLDKPWTSEHWIIDLWLKQP